MKTTYKIISYFLFLTIAFSCKKQDLPAKPTPSPFSATAQNSAPVLSGGGTVKIDIKAGSDGWWLTIPPEAQAWCSSSQLFGSGDKTITLTFAGNTSGAKRSVSVIFNPTFNLPAQTIVFEQN